MGSHRSVLAAAFLAAGLLAALVATAASAEPVGAVFLRVGVGARSAGLADADIVSGEDASVLHWSPAALSRVTSPRILLAHNEWLGDVRQEFLGGAFPYKSGVIGVGANGMYVGNIPRYVDAVPTESPQGDFGAYDLAFGGGYARPIGKGLSAGAGLKMILQQIDIHGAWSVAFDLGAQYETPIEGLDLALVVANLGPSIEFLDVSADLPLEGRFGAGWRHRAGSVGLGVFGLARASRGITPRGQFGAEVGTRGVSVRAGLKLGYDVEDASFGFGYDAGPVALDYAFVPFSEDLLGEAHRFALSLKRRGGS